MVARYFFRFHRLRIEIVSWRKKLKCLFGIRAIVAYIGLLRQRDTLGCPLPPTSMLRCQSFKNAGETTAAATRVASHAD